MVLWYQNYRFLAILGFEPDQGETNYSDQMASRAKNLDFLAPCWLLSCLLGTLPQGPWGLPFVFVEVLGQLMSNCMVSRYQDVDILMALAVLTHG